MRANEKRLVEAATRLIAFEGGTINYTKLLKLLYIADRESLRRHHNSITGDDYISMNAGPVLSHAYNLIKGEASSEIWSRSVSPRDGYNVSLLAEPACVLSAASRAILDEVYEQYGHMNYGQLIDLVHTYPEWRFPKGSCLPISLESLLRGCGYENQDASSISGELEEIGECHRILGIA